MRIKGLIWVYSLCTHGVEACGGGCSLGMKTIIQTKYTMKQTYCFFLSLAHRVLTAASAHAKLLTVALCLFSVGNAWGGQVVLDFEGTGTFPYNADWNCEGTAVESQSSNSGAHCVSFNVTSSKYITYKKFLSNVTSASFCHMRTTNNTTNPTITLQGSTDNISWKNLGSVTPSIVKNSWGKSTITLSENFSGYIRFQYSCSTTAVKYLDEFTIVYEDEGPYIVTAVANPTEGGGVSVDGGNKITATPNEGWQISTTPYTVTSGTATVKQSGNEFTVTPLSNCTVQINFEKIPTIPTYTLTYYVGNDYKDLTLPEGTEVLSVLPSKPLSCDATSTTFIGWATAPINGKQSACPELIAEDATITSDMTLYAVFAGAKTGTAEVVEDVTDELTCVLTEVSGTSYTNWYGKKATSDAQYTGNSAGSYNSIQLRTTNNTSGIISTTSGGKLRKVIVDWNTNTAGGRTLDIYVKQTAYTTTSNLYNSTTYGVKVGSIVYGTSTEYELTDAQRGDAYFVGLRSNNGAMYLNSIKIVWEKSATTYTDYMTACEECQDLGKITWSTAAANLSWHEATLSWSVSSAAHITGYSVHVEGVDGNEYTKDFVIYGAENTTVGLTELTLGTKYKWTVTARTEDGYCTTTAPVAEFTTKGKEQLPAPTELKVEYIGDNQYTFSWGAVTGATEYKITSPLTASLKSTSATRTLTNLTPGETYSFMVQAIGDGTYYGNSKSASIEFTAHVYTLTLSVTDNGTTTTTKITEPKYTLPAATTVCDELEGYAFAGWSETDIEEESTTMAPTLFAAGKEYPITSDQTLYAVFSKAEDAESDAEPKTLVLTASDFGLVSTYSVHSATKDSYDFMVDQGFKSSNNGIQMNPNKGEGVLYNTTPIPNLKSVTLNVETGAKKSVVYQGVTVKPQQDEAGSSNTTATISIAPGNEYFTIKAVEGAIYFSSIQITYGASAAILYTTAPQCIDCADSNNDCPEYPLVLNDRGQEFEVGSYWVGQPIEAVEYTPQGECDGYEFKGWTTERGLTNATETEWRKKKISFPYRMPKPSAGEETDEKKVTLYAVYSSDWSDDYQQITSEAELEAGEYIIAAHKADGEDYALSFVRTDFITTFGAKPITPDENYTWESDDPEIIWTIGSHDEGYTLEPVNAKGLAKRDYLNINGQYLQFENAPKYYTISEVSDKNLFTLCSADGDYCMTYTDLGFEAGTAGEDVITSLHFYKRVKNTRYSTSTNCDPSILSIGTVAITAAPGMWVESAVQSYIFAERLDLNPDGASAVDIIATSSSSKFTLKKVGEAGAGSGTLTLKTGETRSAFAEPIIVVYHPQNYGVIEKGTIRIRVTAAGNRDKVYAEHSFTVNGRSLPDGFVIAAQTEGGEWVALPADLATSSLAPLKTPYSITVDNTDNPTMATMAPATAVYYAADRIDADKNTRSIRLQNEAGLYLSGDPSREPDDRLWLSELDNAARQSWVLRSLGLDDYYIRLQAAPAGTYLYYNQEMDGGKIGYYEYSPQSRLRLRLLPVQTACMRYDAPAIKVGQLTSTSVTLTWPDIQDGLRYEYRFEDGNDADDTWYTFDNLTVSGTNNVGQLEELKPGIKYTVHVRVGTSSDDEINCSDESTVTFTLPECDNAPYNVWASTQADKATIMWETEAETATVKIYTGKELTELENLRKVNVQSPCVVTGLKQNTTYYCQVFVDETCGSAIAKFTTESNDISIVEWQKEAVVVDINTEIGEDVELVIEKRTEHNTETIKTADDLFFSKYYEATGNVKLLGLFNGTKDTISLENIYIYIGVNSWGNPISLTGYGIVPGYIAPQEEILLWHYVESNQNDNDIVSCLFSNGTPKIDESILSECPRISFGGRASIALTRGEEIIDIIGATTEKGTISTTSPVAGVCKPSWGDDFSHCGYGYSVEDGTTLIELSTNRCLLVRNNQVKSGADAVEANANGTFVTLGNADEKRVGEWLGRQVSKGNDNGVQASCDGFAYVGSFDYDDYYVTYDKMEIEFKGTSNADGTYTINVPDLPAFACSEMRIRLKKADKVTATREQTIPIIIDTEVETDNEKIFSANGLTEEICATCDVVVRDKGVLAHVNGGISQFRYMHIYHGSKLEIPEGTHMQLEKLRMFALNDEVSYAIINNAAEEDASIVVNEVSHVKRIDGKYWYPFSLPYDCRISDIGLLNGKKIGTYGVDWGIKYYDGERRQQAGTSAALGDVSQFWYMLDANDVLEANKGYIIGLFVPQEEESHFQSIDFVPANIRPYTESAEKKTTYVRNWSANLEADARHHGWNFTGSPYISLFGIYDGNGLYNDQLQMGYTDTMTGEQKETDLVYISTPDGADSRTYTQTRASTTSVKPFTAYFVQAIDPEDDQPHLLELTYRKMYRALPGTDESVPAPRKTVGNSVLWAELNLTLADPVSDRDVLRTDNTGVLVSDRYSTAYEIGRDLTKMYAAAGKPQLYTLCADNGKMAYNAIPDNAAHNLPLGMYVPCAGRYTLSLDTRVSRLAGAEAVYLLYNGAVAANLLYSDYTFTASDKGEQTGYSLDIRRAAQVVTSAEEVRSGAPYASCRDGVLVIGNLPDDATVQVYDVLGRLMYGQHHDDTSPLLVPAPQTGVYTVVVSTAQQQYVFKSLIR